MSATNNTAAAVLLVCVLVCLALPVASFMPAPAFAEEQSSVFECLDDKGKMPTTCEACAALKPKGVLGMMGGGCLWCVRDGPGGYSFDKGDCVTSRFGCLKGVSFDLDKCKQTRKDRETSQKEVDAAIKKEADQVKADQDARQAARKKEDEDLVKLEKTSLENSKQRIKELRDERLRWEKERAKAASETRQEIAKRETGAEKEFACRDGCARADSCERFCATVKKSPRDFKESTASESDLRDACKLGCKEIRSFPSDGPAGYRTKVKRGCDKKCFQTYTTITDFATRNAIEKEFEDTPVSEDALYAANSKGFRLAASCRDGCNAKCPRGNCIAPEACKQKCYGFVEKQSDPERNACIFGCELLDSSNYKSKEVSGKSEFFCRNECARFG